jgi:hypothetical protein
MQVSYKVSTKLQPVSSFVENSSVDNKAEGIIVSVTDEGLLRCFALNRLQNSAENTQNHFVSFRLVTERTRSLCANIGGMFPQLVSSEAQ